MDLIGLECFLYFFGFVFFFVIVELIFVFIGRFCLGLLLLYSFFGIKKMVFILVILVVICVFLVSLFV